MYRLSKPKVRIIASTAVAVVATTLTLGSGTATAAPGATSAPSAANTGASEPLQRAGSVNVRTLPPPVHHTNVKIRQRFDLDRKAAPAATTAASLPPPRPANTGVVINNQARRGFEGISEADNSSVNGFALEPPDQGLCVGKVGKTTVVVESVNLAIRFYTEAGFAVTPTIPINELFGLSASDFFSDPKCYYDADTQRWFHTILDVQFDQNGNVSDAFTALAVSKTRDPLDGYYQYRIPALDRSNAHCPCFGDQPLLGADKYGFYVSTAEYTLSGAFFAGPLHFNGAQLYAISKAQLVAGTASRLVHYRNVTTQSGTLQPATSPMAQYATSNGGTEYLVSGRDTLLPDGRLRPGQVRAVTAWALTDTSALDSASGRPRLLSDVVPTEVYGQPVPMTQRSGPRPLGDRLGEPTPRLSANDERVNQVVFAAGRLYTGVNTIVAPGPRTGVAWFIITPRASATALTATVHAQGYVAVANANVAFPSIGVNTAGNGVIAMSLSGAGYYPSAAYQRIGPGGTSGPVTVARLGFRPEDGFTCYPEFGGDGVCRWGDYSASVVGPDGRIWSATEFISDGPRDRYANWSTFVWPVLVG